MRLMNAWINPLAFLDVDGPPAPNLPDQPTPQTILGFICPPGTSADVGTLVGRYKEISSEPVALAGGPEIDICPDAMYLRLTGKSPEEIFPGLRSVHADA